MIGRVEINDKKPYMVGQDINWDKLVFEPERQGCFIEAFASADAIIDWLIQWLIRQLYSESKCQDLINELIYAAHDSVSGNNFAKVLVSKKVINQDVYEKILHFKKARNLVSHNIKGEYSLIIRNPDFMGKYSNQKELDVLVKSKVHDWIMQGYAIFEELTKIIKAMDKDKINFYFSVDFYKLNSRIQEQKKVYPSEKILKRKKYETTY
ncbi:MAG TPA: hypothetical protein PLI99_01065 [archaeon]|nr:hypothetical protein [archaeon]